MKNITVRLEESTVQRLDKVTNNRSEYVRNLIVSDLEDGTNTHDSSTKVEQLRDERDRIRESLTEKRVEAARLEATNERLQSDLDRVRDERDSAQARYHEAHTKLKLHNSERDGLLSRLSGLLSR
ncbi:hypothetical protein [Haladaptatus sp. NG-SE-30]